MTGMAAYGAMFAAIGPGARPRRPRSGLDPSVADHATSGPHRLPREALAAYLVVLPTLVWVFLPAKRLGCASTWGNGAR